MSQQYKSIQFTVSGRVQGVFFRKHTASKAQSLGLTGWVRNTPVDTVEGEFEYACNEKNKAEEFKYWLSHVGSPKSRIDACLFDDVGSSDERRFEAFKVVR
jgi:acylphosphatase